MAKEVIRLVRFASKKALFSRKAKRQAMPPRPHSAVRVQIGQQTKNEDCRGESRVPELSMYALILNTPCMTALPFTGSYRTTSSRPFLLLGQAGPHD